MADTEPRDAMGTEPVAPIDAPRNPGGTTPAEFDRDVNLRAVVWTGLALAGITAVAFILAWFFYLGLARSSERRDPPPPLMPEAAQPMTPPGPRLQVTPEIDLHAFRAAEDQMLTGYARLDGDEGHARIPIERAMAMVLARGMGEAAPPAAARDEVEAEAQEQTETAGPPETERTVEPAGLAGDEQVETPDGEGGR